MSHCCVYIFQWYSLVHSITKYIYINKNHLWLYSAADNRLLEWTRRRTGSCSLTKLSVKPRWNDQLFCQDFLSKWDLVNAHSNLNRGGQQTLCQLHRRCQRLSWSLIMESFLLHQVVCKTKACAGTMWTVVVVVVVFFCGWQRWFVYWISYTDYMKPHWTSAISF